MEEPLIVKRGTDVEPESDTAFGRKDTRAYFDRLAETFADVAEGLQQLGDDVEFQVGVLRHTEVGIAVVEDERADARPVGGQLRDRDPLGNFGCRSRR